MKSDEKNESLNDGGVGGGRRFTPKLKKILIVLAFNAFVSLIVFTGAELAYRWIKLSGIRFEKCHFYEYDEKLGWTPKPGTYRSVTITSERFRQTSPPEIKSPKIKILALGDSVTFGNTVSDNETWPYYLSEQLGCSVINAGVSGYGLDQMVLRLAGVISQVRPALVILSLISDDVWRCELSYRGRYKPYYDIIGGKLKIFNQPVPTPKIIPPGDIWDYSLIIRRLRERFFKGNYFNLREHDRGMEVARRLFSRAQSLCRAEGSDLIIILLPERTNPIVLERETCGELEIFAREMGVAVINFISRLDEQFRGEAEEKAALFEHPFLYSHINSEGNQWIAQQLSDYITEHFPLLSVRIKRANEDSSHY